SISDCAVRWTRFSIPVTGRTILVVALALTAAPFAQQPPGSPSGGSSTAGVFAPVKDARKRPITAGGFVDGAPVVFEDRTMGSGRRRKSALGFRGRGRRLRQRRLDRSLRDESRTKPLASKQSRRHLH